MKTIRNEKQRTWKSIQLTTKEKNLLIIFTWIILRYRTKLIIHHGHFNYVSRSEKSFIKYERHFVTHVSLRHVLLQSVTSPQRNFANASLRHKSHFFSIPEMGHFARKNITSPKESDFGKNRKIYRLTIFCPSHACSAKWFICEVNVNVTLVRRSDAFSKYNWLINKWSKS